MNQHVQVAHQQAICLKTGPYSLRKRLCTECDVVLPFLKFPVPHLLLKVTQYLLTSSSSSSPSLVFSFYLYFNEVFYKAVTTQDVSY